ncbi:TIGR03016 family PEP-CTERM system-associated outer membrane protein [Thalassomonas actiniarum]|uniref:TIGR03016 family PEP-CTERM system-associated outer membrane protein n=1 Tax=Thalassomonas actiniarum TaxID=485447 RepID=A0AAF0C3Y9_9GAMM|nr:TIGR03016 family PEP-CTERM system-associated outer membrane protein [Thalassomonas actiniarum]WDD99460.1 TIGR03016 family PEP-CTERM system-associated outer membrane protein [Thalassomonas actiniarum]
MAITVINRKLFPLAGIALAVAGAVNVQAGEWTIEPSLSVTGTASDNIDLHKTGKVESYISQIKPTLDVNYLSRRLELVFQASNNFINYSHNSDNNDDYDMYQLDGSFSLWDNGPKLFVRANKDQVQQSISNNAIADLLTANAVSLKQSDVGLSYNLARSNILMRSQVYYQSRTSDNTIGDREGVIASLSAENGSAAKYLFWSTNASFQDLTSKNNTNDTKFYSVDAKLGLINDYRFMPFIRVYDEDNQGSFESSSSQSNLNSNSWGPGIRWQVSDHLWLDLAYNYVDNQEENEDHLSGEITWRPSPRTALQAQFSKRFFGDSYGLDFVHQNRRLVNSISYAETVQSFDRFNYIEVDLGSFYCPPGGDFTLDQCLVNPDSDLSDYILVPLTTLEPVEADEISLQKDLEWQSILTLPRTTFTLTLSANRRENLTSKVIDDRFNGDLDITRALNSRSNLSYAFSFIKNDFDTDNIAGAGQLDHYRVHTIKYNRSLNESLSSDISLRHVSRDSTGTGVDYQESRLEFTIKKVF